MELVVVVSHNRSALEHLEKLVLHPLYILTSTVELFVHDIEQVVGSEDLEAIFDTEHQSTFIDADGSFVARPDRQAVLANVSSLINLM